MLVQSLTYVACFQAIRATGATPVACEVTDDTLTIDLEDAERKVTPRTKAIIPVHYAGQVGDLDAIYAFAKKHNLRVIEDASHGFGTIDKGRKIGSFGDVACISMDGIKNITSGEGGMIITDDPKVQKYHENNLSHSTKWVDEFHLLQKLLDNGEDVYHKVAKYNKIISERSDYSEANYYIFSNQYRKAIPIILKNMFKNAVFVVLLLKIILGARNKGIKAATGDWINFMNAGDGFHNDYVVNEFVQQADTKYDIIYGSIIKVLPDIHYRYDPYP